jgi:hypothetical protein
LPILGIYRGTITISLVELASEPRTRRNLSGEAAFAGIVSAALLGASIRWAHHWNAVTVTIVAAWAVATLAALAASVWTLWVARPTSRRLARLGLVLGLLSLAALAVAGVAFAAGGDPAGACGGP